MLAALAASGQTPSAFARHAGIGLHRVSYWRARLGDERPPRTGFMAVTVRDEASAPRHDDGGREPRVEMTLANGRRVAFAGRWDVATIAPWLRALEGA
jgi:hypothetical protein